MENFKKQTKLDTLFIGPYNISQVSDDQQRVLIENDSP